MSDQIDAPDNSDNVLAFTKRFDKNSDIKEMRNLVEAPPPEHKHHRCQHANVLVDEHYRQLTCRRCGAVVDAFDWILARTKGESKIDWELRALRQEITDHRQGLEKLKREEVNCRARIKTAQFRLADVNADIDKANKEMSFLTERLEQVRKLRGAR
ncbi:hypothetical protein PMPD1_2486 [Paramixta manurensis]|uniref:Bacteriophage protein n=1 Tax=Paramixta manurensis TaxID=2740817 RepID=A0A6M8U9L8_9GAMM|nr:hypothetical protein PMPD1_2486 [Erwiniaceae bacterium PD-1]